LVHHIGIHTHHHVVLHTHTSHHVLIIIILVLVAKVLLVPSTKVSTSMLLSGVLLLSFVEGFAGLDSSTSEHGTLHFLNSSASFILIGEFHKAKAFALLGLRINDDL